MRREQRDAPEDIQWSINPTQEVDSTLRCGRAGAGERGLETVTEAREGDPADVLCDIAEEHGADLLVVGNRGMQRRVLGSVPNSVSHKAPVLGGDRQDDVTWSPVTPRHGRRAR